MKLLEEIRTLNDAIEMTDEMEVAESSTTDPVQIVATLKTFAPLLIVVLGFVKLFTGAKADQKIDDVIGYLSIIRLLP
jgi:hypothetical protein